MGNLTIIVNNAKGTATACPGFIAPNTRSTVSMYYLNEEVIACLHEMKHEMKTGKVYGVLESPSGTIMMQYMGPYSEISMDDVPAGTYTLYIYHYPNTGLNYTEYWGSLQVRVVPDQTSTYTFTRNMPWIYGIYPSETNVLVNQPINITIVVKNPLSNTVQGILYLFISNGIPTTQSITPLPITIKPGLNNYKFEYTPTSQGVYYIYVILKVYINQPSSQLVTTDQYNWAQVFKAIVVPTYSVTFIEYGIPSNILSSNNLEWSVTLNGTTQSATSASPNQIVFNVPNGQYSYTITPPPGYYVVNQATGEVSVDNSNVNEIVIFAPNSPGNALSMSLKLHHNKSTIKGYHNFTLIITLSSNGDLEFLDNSGEEAIISQVINQLRDEGFDVSNAHVGIMQITSNYGSNDELKLFNALFSLPSLIESVSNLGIPGLVLFGFKQAESIMTMSSPPEIVEKIGYTIIHNISGLMRNETYGFCTNTCIYYLYIYGTYGTCGINIKPNMVLSTNPGYKVVIVVSNILTPESNPKLSIKLTVNYYYYDQPTLSPLTSNPQRYTSCVNDEPNTYGYLVSMVSQQLSGTVSYCSVPFLGWCL